MTSPKEWSVTVWSVIAVSVVSLGMLTWFFTQSGLLGYVFSDREEVADIAIADTSHQIKNMIEDCFVSATVTCPNKHGIFSFVPFMNKYLDVFPRQFYTAVVSAKQVNAAEPGVIDGTITEDTPLEQEASTAATVDLEEKITRLKNNANGPEVVFYAGEMVNVNAELATALIDAWTNVSYNPSSFKGSYPFGEPGSKTFYDFVVLDMKQLRQDFETYARLDSTGNMPTVYTNKRFGVTWTIDAGTSPATLAVVDYLARKVASAEELAALVEGPTSFRFRYLHLTGVDPTQP